MPERRAPLRVLVVDDNAEFRSAARSWIDGTPGLHWVGSAAGGAEALEILDAVQADLVLMDAFMPEVDGFEATRRIKAREGAPFVFVLSVHQGSDVEREAWAAGADGFVPKAQFAAALPTTIRERVHGARRPARTGRADRRREDGPAVDP